MMKMNFEKKSWPTKTRMPLTSSSLYSGCHCFHLNSLDLRDDGCRDDDDPEGDCFSKSCIEK